MTSVPSPSGFAIGVELAARGAPGHLRPLPPWQRLSIPNKPPTLIRLSSALTPTPESHV